MARPLRMEFPGAIYHVTGRKLGAGPDALRQRMRDSPIRSVTGKRLSRFAGISQREIAEQLGISSGSAVSRRMSSLRERLKQDRRLRKQVEFCEKELARLRESVKDQ